MKGLKSFLLFCILSLFFGCRFFSSFSHEEEPVKERTYNDEVGSLLFNHSFLNITNGESEYLKLSVSPSDIQGKCSIKWEYEEEYVSVNSDNYGAIITGVKPGSTYIKASCNGIVSTCLISVIANGEEIADNPYIYSNYSVIQLKPYDSTSVTVSLYGGSITDMEDFTFTVADESVATVEFSRNNCIITAINTGSTKLTCSHPKADYDYSFVIYVYADKLSQPYITTGNNIISINKLQSEPSRISVDLINPLNEFYKNGFTWNYADEDSKKIINFVSNLNSAEIFPLEDGIANITVTHENAEYPLNITVRVYTIVNNVYISLSEPTVIIDRTDKSFNVYAGIENCDEYVNPELYKWTFPEKYDEYVECISSGNSLNLVGKKNGYLKISVSHPLSSYPRTLLVILKNQAESAVDSSAYITTEQNYVSTQVGKAPTTVTVRLVGGEDGIDNIGDETSNFSWYVKGGRNNGVVEIRQITGFLKDSDERSASVSGSFCTAQLVINPIAEGEVTIAVTHPKCLYETEILVKVYPGIVNPSKTVTSVDSIIYLLNGRTKVVSAILRNADPGDENRVEWSTSDDTKVSVSPSTGISTLISACGSGS
ncbi:MAG: hypothetical protein J5527_09685, partial [Treponema sp.]|nr:hypothetical protein [Treponema sp.]